MSELLTTSHLVHYTQSLLVCEARNLCHHGKDIENMMYHTGTAMDYIGIVRCTLSHTWLLFMISDTLPRWGNYQPLMNICDSKDWTYIPVYSSSRVSDKIHGNINQPPCPES
jgi:hypothetical protein